MNYQMMEYMSNGVIIEDMDTMELVYMNESAKKILQVADVTQKIYFQFLFQADDEMKITRDKIRKDLEDTKESKGIFYVKFSKGIFKEISFSATWLSLDSNASKLIVYVLQDAIEVTGEKGVSFQEVAEFLPNGVAVMDVEQELSVTYANEEHYKILELEEGKKDFKMLKDSLYEEDRDWVMAEIYDNLYKEQDVDIEFRMKTQQNTLKWVRLFGRAKQSANGGKLFYSSLKDLSNRREINDKLHLERVLFHKITELTDEVLFRLDLQTNIIHFLGNRVPELLGISSVIENFPECIYKANIVYQEDMPIFEEMVEAFYSGISKQIELRLHMPNSDQMQWYHIFYSFVKSSEEKPLLIIGKLINIQKQKWLEEQAKIDLLTQFYNKVYTEIEIDALFKSSAEGDQHALFIIDIDNFKAINDNLGHHFGDIVLHDISIDIKSCFRKKDILGRIGGDEFIVVMKDCSDENMIDERASEVCQMLAKTFASHKQSYSISASIGIARYPFDGMTYETLYKNADLALYRTKEGGKNNYTKYSVDFSEGKNQVPSQIHIDKRFNNKMMDTTVIATVFNLLYETNDMELSLKTILEYLGTTYHVDRCYIFQTKDCGKIYQNDYQWTSYSSFITKEEVMYLEEDILTDIFQDANEDGIFCTNNIYEIQNQEAVQLLEKDEVLSIFLVDSIKENDKKAFFGMDDCQVKRIWTERETRTLFHVSRIIFASLTNYNIIRRLKKENAILKDEINRR